MFSFEIQADFFERVLFLVSGKKHKVLFMELLNGGCINNVVKVTTEKAVFCIKINEGNSLDMYEKESNGLEVIRQTQVIDVPEVLGIGSLEGKAFLVMEYIKTGIENQAYWEKLGQQIALLHQHTASQFGLSENNYIGTLPQYNDFYEDGITFFIEKRLKIQAGLAFYEGKVSEKILRKLDKLYTILPDLLPAEQPALLHGDLWSGNVMIAHQQQPVLIDPAVYYGLREAEIAFTRLFGGFEMPFYAAYNEVFALAPQFEERIPIYNLYPLLVHVNLFGSGYLSSIESTLNRFVGN
jgi:fructosamine-3-kinase